MVIRLHSTVATSYVPLRVHSHYSFLDSTLSPAAVVSQAKAHGMKAVALTDSANLHGAVAFVQAAKAAGIKPVLGAELTVEGRPLLLYVESAGGYHNLCRLLSRHLEHTAQRGAEGSVANQERRPMRRRDLDGLTRGLIAVSDDTRLAAMFPKSFYCLVSAHGSPGEFPAVARPAVH